MALSQPAPVRMFQGRRGLLLAGLGVAVVTAAVFGPLAQASFLYYDDNKYVIDNPHVTHWAGWENVAWAFTTMGDYRWAAWHPLTWMSHMLDAQLFGPRAGLHHLMALAMHIASTVLLLVVLTRMTRALWPSALVAALFALHPLHVESVAWISERKDVLSTLFFMLTLLAYAHYARRPGLWRYAAVFVLLALGLLSKPMLVTAPFVLLLLDWWPLGRFKADVGRVLSTHHHDAADNDRCVQSTHPTLRKNTIVRLALEKVPLLALVAASSLVTVISVQKAGGGEDVKELPSLLGIANVAVTYYITFIAKMFWPADLTVYYPHPPELPAWLSVVSAAILIAITVAAVRLIRRRPYLAVGWFWYLGTMVPPIAIVLVGGQAMADHYTYIPLIGLFIMIAWGAADLAKTWKGGRRVVAYVAFLALAACAVTSAQQVTVWQDTETVFTNNLKAGGDNFIAHNALAGVYEQSNRLPEAQAEVQKALALDPNNDLVLANLGRLLYLADDLPGAYKACGRALEINPDNFMAHLNLGHVLAKAAGRTGVEPAARIDGLTRAAREYLAAIRLNPDNSDTYGYLGIVMDELGRPDEAVAAHREAIRRQPNIARLHLNFGVTLRRLGRLDEAADEFREAVRLTPGYALAHLRLGQALVSQHQPVAAAQEFQAALQLDPKLEEARAGLARLKGGP